MSESIRALDLGFRPEAAVSGAILLQSELSATLICNAVFQTAGKYKSAGLAIIEFEVCSITKFGYPNDEAWGAIPRTKGLSYGFYEVLESSWPEEIARLNRYGFPNSKASAQRHFLALFHDSSFECLCRGWKARLSTDTLVGVIADIGKQICQE